MEAGPPIGCPVFLGKIIIKRSEIDTQRATISASIHLLLPFVKQHKMNYLS